MKEFKGTKGEWTTVDQTWDNEQGGKTGTIDIMVGEIWLADCKPYYAKGFESFPNYEEAKANAKLIAASKDLLEALQQCLRNFETNRTGGCNGEGKKHEEGSPYVLAVKAIKKALN